MSSKLSDKLRQQKKRVAKVLREKLKAKRLAENTDFFSVDVFTTPVIYFLYQDNILVYIGSSIKGIQRVSEHIDKARKYKEFDSFSVEYHKTVSPMQLKAIEKSLIRKYNPKYNTNHRSDRQVKNKSVQTI